MRRSFFFSLLLLMCLVGSALAAGGPLEMQTEDERLVKWDLTADSLSNLNDNEIMEARGNVYLRRGNEYLKADFARYYASTNWVYLKGNVIVRMGKDELKAEEAEFDLRSRVGWLKKGRIFMAGPHAYLAGERIDKHWGDVYTFKQAKITTCDGDSPAWSLTAEEAVVEIDGYARLSRSTFQVKDVPVAFAPYFVIPTKSSRQTGFLAPEFGSSSTKGLFYNQPFFWAVNDQSDVTVNVEAMEKRGLMYGMEYRAKPSTDTTAWLRMDWIHDNERETNDRTDYYPRDGLVRTNSDRYWLRGMYDTRLGDPNWRLKADIDYTSDPYFIREFARGFSGFNRNRDELFSLFRRDLREKYENRVSGILLTRDWERASIAASAQYTQNVRLGNGNTPRAADTTLQRLPQFDAFLHKGRVHPDFPLEAQASAQAAYMYRRSGTRGARYQVVPQLSLPLSSRYGSIITSATLHQNLYETEHPSKNDSSAPLRENNDASSVVDFNIAAATEFSRVYAFDTPPLPLTNSTVGKSQWVGLRHSIQPRLEFTYRPSEDQERNPNYDEEDRLSPRTELVYSLTNVLTRKRETVVLAKNEKGQMEPTIKTSYVDFLRLRLEQGYDYREADRDAAYSSRDRNNKLSRRPFSDVLGELMIRPVDNLSLVTKNYWSPYLNELTRHQSTVNVNIPGWGQVYGGYDYRRKMDEYKRLRTNEMKYVVVGGALNLWGPFSVGGSYRYDPNTSENRETELNLIYQHQCFTLMGRMSKDPQETSYQLLVVLAGLGDGGGR